jgi:RimJ/RimL family protein N-acetyltransferase
VQRRGEGGTGSLRQKPAPVEFDAQPTLLGETLSLRPLAAADFAPLYAAASDPLIWSLHPEPLRYRRAVFEQFFEAALDSRSALVVTDNASGEVVGSSRYYDWNPTLREVAIGYTFLARSRWGGATNLEMKRLMLGHAFRWADTVWFHVGRHNLRSRRAMEKVGGILDHEERRELNGAVHDYVVYRIDAPWNPPA